MSKKEKCRCAKRTSIGGQALMEGIMMRGPQKSAMAVRRPNGEIYFDEQPNEKKKRPAFCRWPIIRGVFGFVDSMVMGYKYLMRSAEIAMEETEETHTESPTDAAVSQPSVEEAPSATAPDASDPKEKTPVNGVKKAKKSEPKSTVGKGTMAVITVIATVLGVLLAVGLFVWLPTFLYTKLIEPLSFWPDNNLWLKSIFEGFLKIVVLVLYMALVSLMKDIRRTFMYHGAEHKTIFCYENGLPLTVENVKKQGRFHPRCGTSFLILMMLVSIAIGFLIPPYIEGIPATAYTFIRAGIKLLLIPLTMGVGYELLKLAGKYDNLFTRIISAPGRWLQRITVREPTDDMIECAIQAFIAVMPEEDRQAMEAEMASDRDENA